MTFIQQYHTADYILLFHFHHRSTVYRLKGSQQYIKMTFFLDVHIMRTYRSKICFVYA